MRRSTSRVFSAVFHGCLAYAYIHGMWCDTWFEKPHWPMRTSRASSISWIVPP